MLKLLRSRKTQILASDAHDPKFHPPNLGSKDTVLTLESGTIVFTVTENATTTITKSDNVTLTAPDGYK